MKGFVALVCTLCWMVIVLPGGAAAGDLHVVASGSFPPYVYTDDQGEITGITTEFVRAVLERAGIPETITQYPVSRAMHLVREEPRIMIMTVFRTPEREEQFHWIAPSSPPITSVLFRLTRRNDIRLGSLDDARPYRLGVVRGNNLHELLLARGFSEPSQLDPVVRNDQNISKLFLDRIDLMAGREMPTAVEIQTLGYSWQDLTPVLTLDSDVVWMACSLDTPEHLLLRLRDAARELHQEGVLEEIHRRYLFGLGMIAAIAPRPEGLE
ncbi:amino acid ABC transporter substrate-binding protein, PAAT family [Alkalispirochaeta americana]|uniref:Amino acid ABC transporter substrate-binding protein, PAAT family n=1 Tax=Alkalispirochaeta americana TaxID=159291 RepID=A0A1N6UV69_9SPIO|nr:transporter substrate-binding domain-containing protein [Alkalispirochaeta americana]SIQ69497.1 amino acid ABC transporter substrate-binding protein, PAAT family [Alkalispirochaeta americana]